MPVVRSLQWVLTFPRPLHTYLAYFPHALTEALDLFIETLRYHYHRRCLPSAPHPPKCYDVDYIDACYRPRYPHDLGALTNIQRHTDALSLYPHFHAITTDGLFVASGDSISGSRLTPRAPVNEADFILAELEDLSAALVKHVSAFGHYHIPLVVESCVYLSTIIIYDFRTYAPTPRSIVKGNT